MNPTDVVRTIGWGLFCACSWTWCIGMFLPKIMIDRYGWLGFVVFAVPNVLGCVGFGYMIRSAERSGRMIARHRRAMVMFSLVSIGYHAYFIPFLLLRIVSPEAPVWVGLILVVSLFMAAYALSLLRDGAWLLVAGVVYAISAAAFFVLPRGWSWTETHGAAPLADVVWLAPVIAIGFIACPWLDLTFHRAVQRAPSRHAFLVFGVSFSVMLLLTCQMWFSGVSGLVAVALAHVLAQSVFTVGAHLREMREGDLCGDEASRDDSRDDRRRMGGPLVLWCIAAAVLGAVVPDYATGEAMYIRYLVFYGLMFPLYVVVFIGPARPAMMSRPALAGAGLVALVLLPFYEAGYLRGMAWALSVPVLIAVVWIIARGRAVPAANHASPAAPH